MDQYIYRGTCNGCNTTYFHEINVVYNFCEYCGVGLKEIPNSMIGETKEMMASRNIKTPMSRPRLMRFIE